MTATEFRRAFPLFRDSRAGLIEELLAAGRTTRFPAGKQLYAEGDACDLVAFVVDGLVRVYKMSEAGKEITLYEIGAGETCILNASCVLSGTSYPAYAVTASACELFLIPTPAFRRIVSAHEEMRSFIAELLSRRLASVMELVEEVAFGRMDERLLEYLIAKAENDVLHTTHQKIANELGTSREVVSRLLKDFERKGGVRLSRTTITLLHGARGGGR